MTQEEHQLILEQAEQVFRILEQRPERRRVAADDMDRIRKAFALADEAHSEQRRKNGQPYIIHPIAVARIVAEEMQMGANPVIAAFLHDVVEDTPHTIEDVKKLFGNDVAFLVRVVTKNTSGEYELSKQIDNFRKMLDSIQYDIRPLMVKLADRLHNMRTLGSMPPAKQMKIAGETDYFYAPLANRLGLYNIKVELENLSMRYRCPLEFEQLEGLITADKETEGGRINDFARQLQSTLTANGIDTRMVVEYRRPYSLWRKMNRDQNLKDFKHVPHRHFLNIVYTSTDDRSVEKDAALRIYSLLTDNFSEKPGSVVNYIDSPKENGYQSLHVQLMAPYGCWEDVYISSERMRHRSQVGIAADDENEMTGSNIRQWIGKFRHVLKEMAANPDGTHFMENISMAFYNDDITVFSPRGREVRLPKRASAIDFAFDIHTDIGRHAHHAFINGQLASIKSVLHRGDIVEIITSPDSQPSPDWLDHVLTYRAKNFITRHLAQRPRLPYTRCTCCDPIPGEEVIGFKQPDGSITVHKRSCGSAISLATQYGDTIVPVNFDESPDVLYPVQVHILAADRYHLLSDMVNCLSQRLNLSITNFTITTIDGIVNCDIEFPVHSLANLDAIVSHLKAINNVDEVTRVALNR